MDGVPSSRVPSPHSLVPGMAETPPVPGSEWPPPPGTGPGRPTAGSRSGAGRRRRVAGVSGRRGGREGSVPRGRGAGSRPRPPGDSVPTSLRDPLPSPTVPSPCPPTSASGWVVTMVLQERPESDPQESVRAHPRADPANVRRVDLRRGGPLVWHVARRETPCLPRGLRGSGKNTSIL